MLMKLSAPALAGALLSLSWCIINFFRWNWRKVQNLSPHAIKVFVVAYNGLLKRDAHAERQLLRDNYPHIIFHQ